MKNIENIEKAFRLRTEAAERELAKFLSAKNALLDRKAQTLAAIEEELLGCDAIDRAPFRFAIQYCNAELYRIKRIDAEIADIEQDEIAARDELRQKHKDQKEFDVYATRKRNEARLDARRKAEKELTENATTYWLGRGRS